MFDYTLAIIMVLVGYTLEAASAYMMKQCDTFCFSISIIQPVCFYTKQVVSLIWPAGIVS